MKSDLFTRLSPTCTILLERFVTDCCQHFPFSYGNFRTDSKSFHQSIYRKMGIFLFLFQRLGKSSQPVKSMMNMISLCSLTPFEIFYTSIVAKRRNRGVCYLGYVNILNRTPFVCKKKRSSVRLVVIRSLPSAKGDGHGLIKEHI